MQNVTIVGYTHCFGCFLVKQYFEIIDGHFNLFIYMDMTDKHTVLIEDEER